LCVFELAARKRRVVVIKLAYFGELDPSVEELLQARGSV